MRIKGKDGFKLGYNKITNLVNLHQHMLMDYEVLKLSKGMAVKDNCQLEKIYLLLYGEIKIKWDGHIQTVKRTCFLDNGFWALNVCENVDVEVIGISEDSELAVIRTQNSTIFTSSVRDKSNSVIETRGKGFMDDAGTRIVKTLNDKKLSPYSNIMFGEDVHYPGKWAGFPSHSHVQPEIYFYKFKNTDGFGLLKLGDEAVLLEHNDTILINPNLVHPQVAAPGYAMYFLWIIRHLDGNPYLAPTFEEKHLWVEKEGAKYWPYD